MAMAYIGMACMVMACMVLAYIGMACIVMSRMFMAYVGRYGLYGLYGYGLCSYGLWPQRFRPLPPDSGRDDADGLQRVLTFLYSIS